MKSRTLWKLLKERPWLWAVKQHWNPETTDAKVERMDAPRFCAMVEAVWPEVLAENATFWMHVSLEGEEGFFDMPALVAQEVLPVSPSFARRSDWVRPFMHSITIGSLLNRLHGVISVDEVVCLRKSADKKSAEVRVYPVPNGYRDFNALFCQEYEVRKALLIDY